MARLSIAAAPTPQIAQVIQEHHAATQPSAPPIVVPVAPPPRSPLNPLALWGSFLGRLFPTIKPEAVALPSYIVMLIESGVAPAPGPAEDWALLEVWGHFELEQTAQGRMSGQRPGWADLTPEGVAEGLRKRPVEHFAALVLQTRGKVAQTSAICAYALKDNRAAYMRLAMGA